MSWINFKIPNRNELNFNNEKLFYKYCEFIPELEIYKESECASEEFLKFFKNTNFIKVLSFVQKEFNPSQIVERKIRAYHEIDKKNSSKCQVKRLEANNIGNTVSTSEEIILVIDKYIEALCISRTDAEKAFCYQGIGFFFLQLRGYQ